MELTVIGLIIFASGLIQGFSGFGSALVSITLLPFVIDLETAVPFVAVNSMIISSINYYSVRSHFMVKDFLPLLIGSIIGAPVGIIILRFVNPNITKAVLGILIVAYSLYCLFKQHVVTVKLKPVWAYITGLSAGILGGACTVNGPPVIIYLTKKYESKHKIKAILAGFFLVAGIINIIMFALNGLYTVSVCKYSAGFAVFTVIGVFTGNHYYDKINHDIFKKIIYIFLFISGTFLILNSCRIM